MEVFGGRWRVMVVSRDAAWDQRVVIAGSDGSDGAYPGVVGTVFEVDGNAWNLSIQHNDGSGWVDSLLQSSVQQFGATHVRHVGSEDAADLDFNDLVIRCEKIGPLISLPIRAFAVNRASLEMYPDGIVVGVNGLQYISVVAENTWAAPFAHDTVIDISPLGRQYLQAQGIQVLDAWSSEELAATGQALVGTAIALGTLPVGERKRVYFKVDASRARRGKPEVQCHVYQAAGTPDIQDPRRFASAPLFVAEVSYNFSTGEVIASVPEGSLRLKVKSIIADRRGMARACRRVFGRNPGKGPLVQKIRNLLAGADDGRCDQDTLRAILELLCNCVSHEPCGCGGGGGSPAPFGGCMLRFLWLPVDFEYSVETGGFAGKLGPLPFEDPWWKVLLIILAVIFWIVGAIAQGTGAGRSQQSRAIGTVGAFSTSNVDCCLIELNGERGFRQAVPDALAGEPNQNPQNAVGGVLPIVPEIAAAFVGMRVFKSGARTGLTHAVVTSTTRAVVQCRGEWNDATSSCTPNPARPNLVMNNQVDFAVDPAFNEQISNPGDSGSLWLSNEPETRNQVVALNHSGAGNTATGNPIQDVLNALNVRLTA